MRYNPAKLGDSGDERNLAVGIANHLQLTGIATPLFANYGPWIDSYRAMRGTGNDHVQIAQAWTREGKSKALAFGIATALHQMIDLKQTIQDPTANPSWGEAYGMGLGQIPWGKIIFGGVAVMMLWGFATRAGSNLGSRQ